MSNLNYFYGLGTGAAIMIAANIGAHFFFKDLRHDLDQLKTDIGHVSTKLEQREWTQGRKNLQGNDVTPSDLSNVVVCFPDDATQRDLYLLSPTGVHGFRPDTDGNKSLSLDKHIEPERDCISLADYMQR